MELEQKILRMLVKELAEAKVDALEEALINELEVEKKDLEWVEELMRDTA